MTPLLKSLIGNFSSALFVEDEESEAFLSQIIQKSGHHVKLVVSGGRNGVRAMTNRYSAKQNPAIGWIDRDFSIYKPEQWTNPSERCFCSERHEIENYLLDGSLLHTCGVTGASADRLEEAMLEEARKQPAWLAYRELIRSIHDDFQKEFPCDPEVSDIPDVDTATRCIEDLSWIRNVDDVAHGLLSSSCVKNKLLEFNNRYLAMLENGEWKNNFSGKEIFSSVFYAYRRGSGTILDVYKRASSQMAYSSLLPDDLGRLVEKISQLQ